jgi:hypothetical protein
LKSYVKDIKENDITIDFLDPIKKNKKFSDTILDIYQVEGKVKSNTKKGAYFKVLYALRCGNKDFFFATNYPLKIRILE